MICRSIDAQPNQINLARRSRWGILLVLIVMVCFQGYAQRQSTIPDDLLTNKTPVDEIVIYQYIYNGPLFWPADVEKPKLGDARKFEHLASANKELYYFLDGTGRVYRVNRDGDFTRIDSTVYVGYNFGAYAFSYRDTLYSIGGYGFWRNNGHLRFFRSNYADWEIKPLNRELPIFAYYPNWSLWLDKKYGNIFYLERYTYQDMNTAIRPADTCKVWKLDLDAKRWTVLGTLKKEVSSVLSYSSRIISLPWGELILNLQYGSRIALLDYDSNQLKELDIQKSDSVKAFILSVMKDNSAVLIYTRDSTLTFHISEQRKLVLHLTENDFMPTGKTMFEPYEKPISIYGIQGVPLGAMACGLFLFLASLWMYYRSYQLSVQIKKGQSLHFDEHEATLIRAMISHPEHTLSAEEVNVLLGTSKKSLDVQRKMRSDMIISINHKYQEKTGRGDALISKVRSDSDKRLVNYFISPEKFELIKEVMPSEL